MLRYNTLGFHAGRDSATGGDEVVGGAAAHGLNPNGVGVDVDADELVVVTEARALAELAGEIGVESFAGIVEIEEDVFFLLGVRGSGFIRVSSACGYAETRRSEERRVSA